MRKFVLEKVALSVPGRPFGGHIYNVTVNERRFEQLPNQKALFELLRAHGVGGVDARFVIKKTYAQGRFIWDA